MNIIKTNRLIVLTIFSISILSSVRAQDISQNRSANNQATMYFEVTKLEKCLIFFPDNYDPEKAYSLLIGLHGNGGTAQYFSHYWEFIRDLDIIFAVPESPYNYNSESGLYAKQYSWDIISDDRELWRKADTHITRYISSIAEGINNKYKINHTILMGFSQGAAYAYATGIRYHQDFDALICFGGKLPSPEQYPWFISEDELQNNNDIKVFIAHGGSDEAISASSSRQAYRLLKKHEYEVKFRLFDGGHMVPEEILQEGLAWILNRD